MKGMYLRKIIMLFIVFSGFVFELSAQTDQPVILLKREHSGYFTASTRGWGVGYHRGNFLTGYSKWMWEVELTTLRHPKEFRRTNELFPNAKTFYYGKLNKVYLLRGALGIQRVLSEKPHWGGVSVRYAYYAGATLGIAEPVYLGIVNYVSSEGDIRIEYERYDPDKHFIDNIYGRGPFGKGFFESSIYPGIYVRTAMNFDYGVEYDVIRALEVGATLDFFPKAIPIMATEDNSNLILTFYLSFHIGNRMK
ncbi:MAG: hypothetical protein RQ866_00125 [Bacteroidales bacterium]|nr:hypothetical protein [Bacteroidales bacterium]